MLYKNGFIIYLVICAGFLVVVLNGVQADVLSASACHNSDTTDCNYMTIRCDPGHKIRLLTMKYGVKSGGCRKGRSHCLQSNKNGCCVYQENDCTEYFNELHAYNLHKQCSGKQLCENMPVPNKILTTCEDQTSTYVDVKYECIPDSSFGDFCEGTQAGNDINLLFTSGSSNLNKQTNCSCFIQTPTGVIVEYVDVRMFKENNENWSSFCSSASLVTIPESAVDTTCVEQSNEQDNFIYGETWQSDDKFVELKLLDLHVLGSADLPWFIWINLIGTQQVSMQVTCFAHTAVYSTTTSGTTQLPPGTTDSKSVAEEDDSSNIGAVVAGVLIPIILIIIICVIIFIIWKRRGYLFKRRQTKRSPPTNIENSVGNEEYAEIGFVPDEPNVAPSYDTVYEPGNKTVITSTNNSSTPVYVNVNNTEKDKTTPNEEKQTGKKSKLLKFPFDKLKAPKDRLISYFKKQTERDFPPVNKESKNSYEKSDESYDHLRPTSVGSNIQIEFSPPINDPKHTYSHTSDLPVASKSVSNETKPIPKSTKTPAENKHDDVNAVHVGDDYIEFQRGPIDKDHPNLLKVVPSENETNSRPNPPVRPPPSPGQGKRKDNSTQNLSPIDTSGAVNRPNSPNHLSPDLIGSRSVSPVGSEISSNHSYKILEPIPLYDYADVSDEELGIAPCPPDELYEDVEGKKASVRKHVSAFEISDENNEYLEPVPRCASASATLDTNAESKDMSKRNAAKSKFSLLKRELKDKMEQNQGSKPKITPTANTKNDDEKLTKASGAHVVKGSRVEEESHGTPNGVMGVLGMAKMFESDSDSSKPNSPRNVQLNKNNKSPNAVK